MNGLRWPTFSGHWLFYNRCWLYLLSMKWLMCGTLILHINTSLGCFCPWTIFTKKRIAQATLDFFEMRFTNYTKDHWQGCSRLSYWFPLRCLGPWMNPLPPAWCSIFRFRFYIFSWCEVWCDGEGFFPCFIAFFVLSTTQFLPIIFPLE